jgi:hypothetical protein
MDYLLRKSRTIALSFEDYLWKYLGNAKANLPDFSEKHSKITLFAIFSARKITLFPKCSLEEDGWEFHLKANFRY